MTTTTATFRISVNKGQSCWLLHSAAEVRFGVVPPPSEVNKAEPRASLSYTHKRTPPQPPPPEQFLYATVVPYGVYCWRPWLAGVGRPNVNGLLTWNRSPRWWRERERPRGQVVATEVGAQYWVEQRRRVIIYWALGVMAVVSLFILTKTEKLAIVSGWGSREKHAGTKSGCLWFHRRTIETSLLLPKMKRLLGGMNFA